VVVDLPVPADWTRASLGERVDHICRIRGCSLNELAQRSGHDPAVLSKLSRNAETVAGKPLTLDSVAEAAGVNVEWLTYGRGPIEGKGMLREQPDWEAVLAQAQNAQRGIPDEVWRIVGDTVFPSPRPLDWQLLVGMVRELFWAHKRYLEERGQQGARASHEPSTNKTHGTVITHPAWSGSTGKKSNRPA